MTTLWRFSFAARRGFRFALCGGDCVRARERSPSARTQRRAPHAHTPSPPRVLTPLEHIGLYGNSAITWKQFVERCRREDSRVFKRYRSPPVNLVGSKRKGNERKKTVTEIVECQKRPKKRRKRKKIISLFHLVSVATAFRRSSRSNSFDFVELIFEITANAA